MEQAILYEMPGSEPMLPPLERAASIRSQASLRSQASVRSNASSRKPPPNRNSMVETSSNPAAQPQSDPSQTQRKKSPSGFYDYSDNLADAPNLPDDRSSSDIKPRSSIQGIDSVLASASTRNSVHSIARTASQSTTLSKTKPFQTIHDSHPAEPTHISPSSLSNPQITRTASQSTTSSTNRKQDEFSANFFGSIAEQQAEQRSSSTQSPRRVSQSKASLNGNQSPRPGSSVTTNKAPEAPVGPSDFSYDGQPMGHNSPWSSYSTEISQPQLNVSMDRTQTATASIQDPHTAPAIGLADVSFDNQPIPHSDPHSNTPTNNAQSGDSRSQTPHNAASYDVYPSICQNTTNVSHGTAKHIPASSSNQPVQAAISRTASVSAPSVPAETPKLPPKHAATVQHPIHGSQNATHATPTSSQISQASQLRASSVAGPTASGHTPKPQLKHVVPAQNIVKSSQSTNPHHPASSSPKPVQAPKARTAPATAHVAPAQPTKVQPTHQTHRPQNTPHQNQASSTQPNQAPGARASSVSAATTEPARPQLKHATTMPARKPVVQPQVPQIQQSLVGWLQQHTPNGKAYYAHLSSGKTTWEHPATIKLLAGWESRVNPDGRIYHYHPSTDSSTWERPCVGFYTAPPSRPPVMAQQLVGWTQGFDRSGTVFFMHTATGRSSWVHPAHLKLGDRWEERMDPDGRIFYWQPETGGCTFARPCVGFDAEPPPPYTQRNASISSARSTATATTAPIHSASSPGRVYRPTSISSPTATETIPWETGDAGIESPPGLDRRGSHFSMGSVGAAVDNMAHSTTGALRKVHVPGPTSPTVKGTIAAGKKGFQATKKFAQDHRKEIATGIKIYKGLNSIVKLTTGQSIGGELLGGLNFDGGGMDGGGDSGGGDVGGDSGGLDMDVGGDSGGIDMGGDLGGLDVGGDTGGMDMGGDSGGVDFSGGDSGGADFSTDFDMSGDGNISPGGSLGGGDVYDNGSFGGSQNGDDIVGYDVGAYGDIDEVVIDGSGQEEEIDMDTGAVEFMPDPVSQSQQQQQQHHHHPAQHRNPHHKTLEQVLISELTKPHPKPQQRPQQKSGQQRVPQQRSAQQNLAQRGRPPNPQTARPQGQNPHPNGQQRTATTSDSNVATRPAASLNQGAAGSRVVQQHQTQQAGPRLTVNLNQGVAKPRPVQQQPTQQSPAQKMAAQMRSGRPAQPATLVANPQPKRTPVTVHENTSPQESPQATGQSQNRVTKQTLPNPHRIGVNGHGGSVTAQSGAQSSQVNANGGNDRPQNAGHAQRPPTTVPGQPISHQAQVKPALKAQSCASQSQSNVPHASGQNLRPSTIQPQNSANLQEPQTSTMNSRLQHTAPSATSQQGAAPPPNQTSTHQAVSQTRTRLQQPPSASQSKPQSLGGVQPQSINRPNSANITTHSGPRPQVAGKPAQAVQVRPSRPPSNQNAGQNQHPSLHEQGYINASQLHSHTSTVIPTAQQHPSLSNPQSHSQAQTRPRPKPTSQQAPQPRPPAAAAKPGLGAQLATAAASSAGKTAIATAEKFIMHEITGKSTPTHSSKPSPNQGQKRHNVPTKNNLQSANSQDYGLQGGQNQQGLDQQDSYQEDQYQQDTDLTDQQGYQNSAPSSPQQEYFDSGAYNQYDPATPTDQGQSYVNSQPPSPQAEYFDPEIGDQYSPTSPSQDPQTSYDNEDENTPGQYTDLDAQFQADEANVSPANGIGAFDDGSNSPVDPQLDDSGNGDGTDGDGSGYPYTGDDGMGGGEYAGEGGPASDLDQDQDADGQDGIGDDGVYDDGTYDPTAADDGSYEEANDNIDETYSLQSQSQDDEANTADEAIPSSPLQDSADSNSLQYDDGSDGIEQEADADALDALPGSDDGNYADEIDEEGVGLDEEAMVDEEDATDEAWAGGDLDDGDAWDDQDSGNF